MLSLLVLHQPARLVAARGGLYRTRTLQHRVMRRRRKHRRVISRSSGQRILSGYHRGRGRERGYEPRLLRILGSAAVARIADAPAAHEEKDADEGHDYGEGDANADARGDAGIKVVSRRGGD